MAKVPAGSGGLGKLESPRRYTHTQAHVFHLPSVCAKTLAKNKLNQRNEKM